MMISHESVLPYFNHKNNCIDFCETNSVNLAILNNGGDIWQLLVS